MRDYILDFPCNGCCLGANSTLLQKYNIVLEENRKFKEHILISIVYFFLINIYNDY